MTASLWLTGGLAFSACSQVLPPAHRRRRRAPAQIEEAHTAPFVQSLQSFTSSRLNQLRLQGPELPYIPVHDSDGLTKLGRSSATQSHRTTAYEVFPDERGGLWHCMRKTFCCCARSVYNARDLKLRSVFKLSIHDLRARRLLSSPGLRTRSL